MVQKTTTATATATVMISASPSDGSVVAQKRSRSSSEDMDAEHEPDIEHNAEDDKPKKRRRVVKMADKDKKYGCPAEGCGKSYSRAEHLYRHQLNHAPKQIYRCDFPGCSRHFVRQDLCARHRERHTANNSHLQRRDVFKNRQHAGGRESNQVQDGDGGGVVVGGVAENDGTGRHDSMYPVQSPITQGRHADASVAAVQQVKDEYMMRQQMENAGIPLDPRLISDAHDSNSQGAQSFALQYPTMGKRHSVSDSTHNFHSQDASQYVNGHANIDPSLSAHSISNPNNHYARPAVFARPQLYPPHASNQSIHSTAQQNSYNNPQSYSPLHTTNIPTHLPQPYLSPSPHTTYKSPSGSVPPFPILGPPPPTHHSPNNRAAIPLISPSPSTAAPEPYRNQDTHPASYVHFDNSILDASLLDQLAAGSSMPVFNSESYSHEPQNMGNDFTAWLFNTDPHFVQPSPSPAPLGPGSANPDISLLPRLDIPLSATSEHSATPHPRHPQDPHPLPSAHQIPAPAAPAAHPHPPIPKTITTSTQRESILTSSRVTRLHNLIYTEFLDRHNPASQALRARILAGDTADPSHVLSQRMLQIHMSSYWLHLHPQIPILHRPTFDTSTCPDLLLLTLITLGASCLESSHPYPTTAAGVELSLFLATHIRHLVLKDGDFVPPAKLWVFQSLLLLELYEKMYADRALHERAHVHHATTLTLMRRGSSLIGRAASDYPPASTNNTTVPGNSGSGSGNGSGSRSRSTRNINDPSSTFSFGPEAKDPEPEPEPESDPTRTPPGPNGSINTSGTNTSDEWWNRWITAEATRRAAFAAFVIDVTHATMFGHSAVMVAHEMRIPLPCDESAWNAGSGAEVKALLAADGKHGGKVKGGGGGQVTFLEGLKKTLSGVPVRTNMFGRVILMAGLLSVSWHMKMQDVRVHSIGVGKQGSWGSQLMHAFDFWKRDFDAALAGMPTTTTVGVPPGLLQQDRNGEGEDCTTHMDNIFESRTVLHHLAHMAMHVDILDCQVFAGATRLLGRVITTQDRAAAQKKMRESWAPTARARDATFYALRFLSAVLMPENVDGHGHGHGYGQGVGKAAGKGAVEFAYSARDDFLLNRPWVLYFATLVVWSYGYALDGPIAPPTYTLSSRENQVHDMQGFLKRVGGVKSPDELLKRKDRNSCLGLLMLLRDMFREARWELLHEASRMLGNCCELLMPGIQRMQG